MLTDTQDALARITDLEARLAAADAGEDALAEALTTIRDDRLICPRAFDCRHIAAAALAAYEARRKG